MEEKQKNHSFGKGLICGILLGAGMLGITGCAGPYLYSILKTDSTQSSEAVLDTETEAKIEELNNYIEQYYLFDYEEEDVKDGIYKGMMAGLGDIYTGYYTPDEYDKLMETTNGTYSGIGAMLQQDYKTGIITVVRAFAGSPAEEAGLQTDDILYMVKGEEVTGKDLSLVVTDLKGEEGTDVDISILRGTDVIDLQVTRRNVEVPTVEYEMLENGIGYIAITSFESVTDEQFLTALDDLESQGMDDLIIDLRGNGGGLVDVTCTILDRLLPEGVIVYTEDKYGRRHEERSDAEHYFAGDMAVLVNGYSASASEIFAGAVKDYGVGTLIGTQTFGKGIVQSIIPLEDGSALKITISRYYTPAGNNIHEVGITPDIILEPDGESEEDNQLQKAIEVLSK